MSTAQTYVAIAEHCVQVGPDTWEPRKEAMPLNGTESVAAIMDWAMRRASKAEQVTITLVKS